jgi:hypothetical protein
MNSVVAPLAERPAWSALSADQKAIGALDLRKLFVDGPAPGKRIALALPSIPAGRVRRIRAVLLADAAGVRGLQPSSGS